MKKQFILVVTILTLVGLQSLQGKIQHLNLASGGYDVVSYQKDNSAIEGSTDYYSFYDNQVYYFSSELNKVEFEKNPQKYIPAFGGYCAMGVALGKKFPVDPRAFKVVNGKTYLNLNPDVQGMWLQDIEGHIQVANEKWETIKDKNPSDL